MPIYVAILPRFGLSDHKMLRRSKKLLHAAAAKTILGPADALRRTAFLDVSSLNFGGAKSTAVFFVPYPHQVQWQSPRVPGGRQDFGPVACRQHGEGLNEMN